MSDIAKMHQLSFNLFEAYAGIAKILGHACRLAMIERLAQKEHSVEELAEKLSMSVANTSQHLQQLKRAGFVGMRQQAQKKFYFVYDHYSLQLFTALRQFAEFHHSQVRELMRDYFYARDTLEALTRDELLSKMQNQDVILLDVRPEDEYEAAHLPQALNIPYDELEQRFSQLPKDRTIVAYCRAHQCILSAAAVQFLRDKGYDIRRLEDGFIGWRAAVLPVEQAVKDT